MTLQCENKLIVIHLSDILYIEADEKKCKIFTTSGEYQSKLKISQLENILPKNNFFRSHRSYIININKVKEIEPWFNGSYIIKLLGSDKKISVSRGKVKEMEEIFVIG